MPKPVTPTENVAPVPASPSPRRAAVRGLRVRTSVRAGGRELSTTLAAGALEGPKKPPVDGE